MLTAISAIVLLGVLIVVHELGHFILAKMNGVGVLKFSLGFGPKIFSKKIGETEYCISAVPLGGFVKMVGEDPADEKEITEEDAKKSFSNKSLKRRAAIVLAGPLFNIFFATIILSVIHMFGVPILTAKVGGVVEGSPAYEGGLQAGDHIVSINENTVSKWEEIVDHVRDSHGNQLSIRVKRGGEYFGVTLKPEPFVEKNIFGEDVETYRMGISVSEEFYTKKYNPFMAVVKGFEQTWWMIKLTGLTVVKLIERTVPAKTLGGPILIVQMAGKQAQAGLSSFLFFMAILSINLGIINLFPVPILDGGHLFFFLIEGIIGRPISLKKMEIAQYVGLGLIIVLMVFVFKNDLERLFTQ